MFPNKLPKETRKNAGPLESLLRKAAHKNVKQRCKGSFASNGDAYGISVTSPSASNWCLVGSLSSLTDDERLFEQAIDLLHSLRPNRSINNLAKIHDSLNENLLCNWWRNAVNRAQCLMM